MLGKVSVKVLQKILLAYDSDFVVTLPMQWGLWDDPEKIPNC